MAILIAIFFCIDERKPPAILRIAGGVIHLRRFSKVAVDRSVR